MYALKLPCGYLTIRPSAEQGCEIWLESACLCACESASAAAELVSRRATGVDVVDCNDSPLPPDIDGWMWISVMDAPRHRHRHQGCALN